MEISPDLVNIILAVLFGGGALEGTKYGIRKFKRRKITNNLISNNEMNDDDFTDPNFDRPVFNTECAVKHSALNQTVSNMNESVRSMQKDLKTIIGFQVSIANLDGKLDKSLATLKNDLVGEIQKEIRRHEDREHPKR